MKRLMPNFSKIVPGVAEVVSIQPEHINTLSMGTQLEFTKLDDFCPFMLDPVEWRSIGDIFRQIAKNDSLSEECYQSLQDQAGLNLAGVLIIISWVASKRKPSTFARVVAKWSDQIEQNEWFVLFYIVSFLN